MKSVRLAICRLKADARARSAAALPLDVAPTGVSWLRFGDDIIYCGAGKSWDRLQERGRKAKLAMREHPHEIDRKRLHVVVQKGRLFQREHPDVPVLIDKGRYLLVDLAPTRARRM